MQTINFLTYLYVFSIIEINISDLLYIEALDKYKYKTHTVVNVVLVFSEHLIEI